MDRTKLLYGGLLILVAGGLLLIAATGPKGGVYRADADLERANAERETAAKAPPKPRPEPQTTPKPAVVSEAQLSLQNHTEGSTAVASPTDTSSSSSQATRNRPLSQPANKAVSSPVTKKDRGQKAHTSAKKDTRVAQNGRAKPKTQAPSEPFAARKDRTEGRAADWVASKDDQAAQISLTPAQEQSQDWVARRDGQRIAKKQDGAAGEASDFAARKDSQRSLSSNRLPADPRKAIRVKAPATVAEPHNLARKDGARPASEEKEIKLTPIRDRPNRPKADLATFPQNPAVVRPEQEFVDSEEDDRSAAKDDNSPLGKGKGSLEGFLKQPDGVPVVGMRLQLRTETRRFVVGRTVTGEDGWYRFDALPVGRYYLEYGPEGRPIGVASDRLCVRNGDNRYDFRSPGLGTIRVQVQTSGVPVSDALVGLKETYGSRWKEKTDATGFVEFPNLPESSYRILLLESGSVQQSKHRRIKAGQTVVVTLDTAVDA